MRDRLPRNVLQFVGSPDKLPLVLNDIALDNRAWAEVTRLKDVLWYEDINGNQHHCGTMGIETIYFLAKDGQEIRYADTGLPRISVTEFWDPSDGVSPASGGTIARAQMLKTSPLFPGFTLDAGSARVLVELRDSVAGIAERKDLDFTKKPFSTGAVFHTVSGETTPNKGTVEWDGTTMTIRENATLFSGRTLFVGKRR